MSFFKEIKKRKILNTFIYYLGASWAIIEAANFFNERYNGNSQILNVVVIIIGFGLPIVIVFQWFRGEDSEGKLKLKEAISYCVLLIGMSYFIFRAYQNQEVAYEESDVIAKSIAVLPFQKIGETTDNDFYGDGFADDIIANLSKASGFVVISRTSSFQFRDSNRSIEEIRNKLKVENVLEGSYRLLNNKIRLNVNLVSTESGQNLWSETFNGTTDNIFALQAEVAEHIGNSLQMELGALEVKDNVNQLAYEYYLKGNDLMRQRYISKATLDESIEVLNKAIVIDSSFAQAYVSCAEVYIKYLLWGYDEYNNVAEKAMYNIQKAQALNANKGDVYGVLAGLYHYDFDWEKSQKYCELAFQENANALYPLWIQVRNGIVLNNRDLAVNSMNRLIQLDPLTSIHHVFLPWVYGMFKEYEISIKLLEHYIDQHPEDNFALWAFGFTQSGLGNYEKAADYLKLRTVKSRNENWTLGYVQGRLGNKTEAGRIAEVLIKKKQSRVFVPAFMIGYIYLGMNELDEAFKWFELAIEERTGWLGYLHIDPAFDNVKSDPRYLDLIKRVNLE